MTPRAHRAPAEGRGAAAPLLALAFLAAVVLSAAGGLLSASAGAGAARAAFTEPYVWRIVRFTLWQAALSTALSALFALPVARALARRGAFPARGALLRLFSLPLALPQLVAVMGLLAVWGRNGWLQGAFRFLLPEETADIYGLTGILLAHVFFNMPLMTRIFTAALERLPGEYWRLAAQLGMNSASLWRHVEWPALRTVLPGAAGLVFMLCATSFTVVLTLGGGPGAATLEVAIYQALRFDFDPPRAVALAGMQLVMTGAVFLALRRFALPAGAAGGLGRTHIRPDGRRPGARIADAFWLSAAAAFVFLPLAGVIIDGLGADLPRLLAEPALHAALAASAGVALAAAALALGLAWSLLLALRGARGAVRRGPLPDICDTAASLILVTPPAALGAGWFIILRPGSAPGLTPPVVVAVINALMSLPFVWRILKPAVAQAQARYGRLCASLGVEGLARLRLVDWPLLRRPLGLAGALALALSIGDLGAIALFGSESFRTLPWLLYQRLGSYRTADAAGLALILLVFVLALMALAEALGEREQTP